MNSLDIRYEEMKIYSIRIEQLLCSRHSSRQWAGFYQTGKQTKSRFSGRLTFCWWKTIYTNEEMPCMKFLFCCCCCCYSPSFKFPLLNQRVWGKLTVKKEKINISFYIFHLFLPTSFPVIIYKNFDSISLNMNVSLGICFSFGRIYFTIK